eukprot:TRINITY_DN6921_c0_g1_i2.p1 TRINITY_DN6921_c0_g1~~TRINITY_DN6921_c0_g1_i2.p1  ORF type:complete len:175 (+),score=22.70 TRINITY_DN6921_c0_g1_i2:329-853(+)
MLASSNPANEHPFVGNTCLWCMNVIKYCETARDGLMLKDGATHYRYNMPAPSANRVKSLDAWKESISNARAQLQHQMTRIENLELMTNYGGQKWTRYVDQLEKLKAQVEVEVTQAREALEQLNWERQQEQTKAGQELYELELQWGELIMKNYQLEVRSRTVGPVCRCSVMECFE